MDVVVVGYDVRVRFLVACNPTTSSCALEKRKLGWVMTATAYQQ